MQIRPASPEDFSALLEVWHDSVRATHSFLSAEDIETLLPIVRDEYFPGAAELWVLCDAGRPVGFMGLSGQAVDSLFITPPYLRRGGGRRLLAHARALKGVLTVDVNEQNAGAVAFYRANGFVVVGRSPLDDGDRPFPILHMHEAAGGP